MDAVGLPIAVIIPTHERPEMTARAVRSALAQRPHPPAEVVVVDDASTDDTAAAAEAAGARVVRRERNGGESAARNSGLEATDQPWVAFLDSDDEWTPEHLATLWPHAQDGSGLGLVGACAQGVDEARGGLQPVDRLVAAELRTPVDVLLPETPVTASGVLARRDLLLRAGGFDPRLPHCADLDAWLRLVELAPGRIVPAPTVRYHAHDAQVSRQVEAMLDARRAVAASYADRPWFRPGVLDRLDGTRAWDEARAAARAGDHGTAVRRLASVAVRPARAAGVVALLRERARRRGLARSGR